MDARWDVLDTGGRTAEERRGSRRLYRRYDPLGRVTELRLEDPAAAPVERYTYDAGAGANPVGRLARAEGAFGSVEYSYCECGIVERKARTFVDRPDEVFDPRLSTVDALAAVFRVPPADLLRSSDAPCAALPLAPLARHRKDEPVTPDHALAELRALIDHARASDADVLSIPLDLADAVTRSADVRAADLLAVLDALDLADCSPRMILPRATLIGRLRLDGADDEARSQAADLCDAAKLRRHLRDALADAVEAEDKPRAKKLRAIFIAADDETLGWQADALAALRAKGERG